MTPETWESALSEVPDTQFEPEIRGYRLPDSGTDRVLSARPMAVTVVGCGQDPLSGPRKRRLGFEVADQEERPWMAISW
jgi:hypothetical protein